MAAVVDDPHGAGRSGQAEAMLQTGRFWPDALHLQERCRLQQVVGPLGERDLLTRVDSFLMLAPVWKSCAHCLQPPRAPAAADER